MAPSAATDDLGGPTPTPTETTLDTVLRAIDALNDDDEFNDEYCITSDYYPERGCIMGASWHHMQRQIAISCIGYLFVFGGCVVVSFLLKTKIGRQVSGRSQFLKNQNERLDVPQTICSALTVILWIYKTYTYEVSEVIKLVDMVCAVIFMADGSWRLYNRDFAPIELLNWESVLDALTISPLMFQGDPRMGGSWLTLAYLRIVRLLRSFRVLADRISVDPNLDVGLSEFTIEVIVKLLETMSVIIIISGTLFIFEILGEVSLFEDYFLHRDDVVGISFLSMCYFTFITISTVGFGDYSPKTTFARIFIFFAVMGGVTFFSLLGSDIISIITHLASGKGKYSGAKKGRKHVILMGGGVETGGKVQLEMFVRALCGDSSHAGDGHRAPEVVMMGRSAMSPETQTFIKMMKKEGHVVHYFVGSPMSFIDLDRVRASEAKMVFVMADFNTQFPDEDDEKNILYSASLSRLCSMTPYRLMLTRIQNLNTANDVGLGLHNCYAINSLKAGMLATCIKIPGFSTVVLNLGLPPVEMGGFLADVRYGDSISPWLKEYTMGTRSGCHGFLPCKKLVGMTFKEAAIFCAENDVILMAAQSKGKIVLNPGNRLAGGLTAMTVLFGVADDLKKIRRVCREDYHEDEDKWIDVFRSYRFEKRRKYTHTPKKPKPSWKPPANLNRSGAASPPPGPPQTPEAPRTAEGSPGQPFSPGFEPFSPDSGGDGLASLSPTRAALVNQAVIGRRTQLAPLASSPAARMSEVGSAALRGADSPGPDAPASASQMSSKTKQLLKSVKWKATKSYTRAKLPGMGGIDHESTSGHRERKLEQNAVLMQNVHDAMSRRKKRRADGGEQYGGDVEDEYDIDGMTDEQCARRAQVVNRGDHVVLLLLGKRLWHQVEAVMASLRYTHHVPVVIVTEGRPPVDLFEDRQMSQGQKMSAELGDESNLATKLAEEKKSNHSDMFVIRGNPRDPLTLAAAGVATCGRICTLSSNSGYTGVTRITDDVDPYMVDATNVLTASVLESVLSEWEHAKLAVVYDWQSQSNIVQLPRTPKNGSERTDMVGMGALSYMRNKAVREKEKQALSRKNSLFGAVGAISPIQSQLSRKKYSVQPAPLVDPELEKRERRERELSKRRESGSLDAEAGAEAGASPVASARMMQKQMTRALSEVEHAAENAAGKFESALDHVEEGAEKMFEQGVKKFSRPKHTILEAKISEEESGLSADDVHFSNVEPRGHHRFAAGRVLPMPYIAALYTQAYYTPGVLEMLEALVNPGKTKQVSVVWAMPIPKHYVEKEYKKLAMKVIRDGGIPLGLLRSPDAGGYKAPLPYVLTLSPGHTDVKLHEHDMMYVIADRVWAHQFVDGE
mmetsp:Transcript_22587/g.52364  ORF Transcript_22587/g.52364 Transcript_22587/m.52364 type:complete len:1354 (+) Transcript_22587:312-4373(+)|eukprot:CAMPEP_0182561944 /NCGR_PEP_ID=MMETSP1324-20130603/4362_1 /TAXON_ID=236786 /ORGANISM="Florenciella sp., Strain RCC1587" /LENGTH=1353 /DNA_ID=CAMNT_0024774735 /DNA_START=252 /DNA_END=4313 /DNA_ORIENTATION=+